MSVNLKTMHICGNILTTKNCNFFAFRCGLCHVGVFGMWASFQKHAEKCQKEHDQTAIEEELLTSDDEINEVIAFYDNHCSNNTYEEIILDENDEQFGKDPISNIIVTSTKLPAKNLKEFHFSLTDPEHKSISQRFVKLLQNYPALWDERHEDFGLSYACIKSQLQLKLDLKRLGYAVGDVKVIIQEIVELFQETKKEWDRNGVVDKDMLFFVNECQFLNVLHKENAEVDEDESLKTEEDEESLEEHHDSDVQVDNAIDGYLLSRRGRKPRRPDMDPKAPVYTLVSSKHQTRNKRIRFHLVDNVIAADFINLVHENPVLWDASLPNFNRLTERKAIMNSWIPRFIEKHNEVFTYDDFSLNLLELRRYHSKLLRRKNPDDKAKKILGLLKFVPEPTRRQKIKCDHCDKLFFSSTNLQGHLYKEHNIGEYPFKCDECNKQFVSGPSQVLHMKQVHLKQFDYACTLCDRSFLQPSNLEMHMHVHTGTKRYICETCGKGFRKRTSLRCHETRVHLRQRNFGCHMCPKAFYTKALLKDHINSHLNIRNFKCPFCSKAFHSSHALMRHKQIHSTVKRYECKMCNVRFHQFVGLNAHMKSRHQFVQEKCVDETDGDGAAVGDYDDPSSCHESIEVKGMDEYVYNFDYDKNE